MKGKVLVTGAEGFIGSHLTEELLTQGLEVRALVQYNFRGSLGWLEQISPQLRKGLQVVLGDIRDPQLMNETVSGCETVFHLAALIGIPYSYRAPLSYVETNVTGTVHLLNAALKSGVSRFLQTSTSEVYGTARTVPITEEHPLGAQSPYAASKIAADQMALSYHLSTGLPVTVVRPFNTFGPRQSARAVIPTIITQLLQGAGDIELKLGSLEPTRDFTFVTDTARGFLAIAQASGAIGETVQLGTDHEISMGELAQLLAKKAGKNAKISTDLKRLRPVGSEVQRLRASFAKAKKLCGWEPEFAGRECLEKGLEKTLAWFKHAENQLFYRPGSYEI